MPHLQCMRILLAGLQLLLTLGQFAFHSCHLALQADSAFSAAQLHGVSIPGASSEDLISNVPASVNRC